MLEVGAEAPSFELPDQNGDTVSLSDYRGERVVLYFYPKARTSGCTTEARGFRDRFAAFSDRDATVLGISADSIEELRRFAEEEDLPFRLLSDEDGTVATRYESFGEREVRGETWAVPYRNTYVIGPDGTIEAVYEGVSPDDHPERVLKELDELAEATT